MLYMTSIWAGLAGGLGYYSKEVGVMRVRYAMTYAIAAIESGRLLSTIQHPGQPIKIKKHTGAKV